MEESASHSNTHTPSLPIAILPLLFSIFVLHMTDIVMTFLVAIKFNSFILESNPLSKLLQYLNISNSANMYWTIVLTSILVLVYMFIITYLSTTDLIYGKAYFVLIFSAIQLCLLKVMAIISNFQLYNIQLTPVQIQEIVVYTSSQPVQQLHTYIDFVSIWYVSGTLISFIAIWIYERVRIHRDNELEDIQDLSVTPYYDDIVPVDWDKLEVKFGKETKTTK